MPQKHVAPLPLPLRRNTRRAATCFSFCRVSLPFLLLVVALLLAAQQLPARHSFVSTSVDSISTSDAFRAIRRRAAAAASSAADSFTAAISSVTSSVAGDDDDRDDEGPTKKQVGENPLAFDDQPNPFSSANATRDTNNIDKQNSNKKSSNRLTTKNPTDSEQQQQPEQDGNSTRASSSATSTSVSSLAPPQPPSDAADPIPALPPLLTASMPALPRGGAETFRLSRVPWTQPQLLLSATRPHASNGSLTELFVYAAGLDLGNFARNFSVAACVVDRQLFRVVTHRNDVFVCDVPRQYLADCVREKKQRKRKPLQISLAVRRNAAVRAALVGPVKLALGLTVTVEQGRLVPLPSWVANRSEFDSDGSNGGGGAEDAGTGSSASDGHVMVEPMITLGTADIEEHDSFVRNSSAVGGSGSGRGGEQGWDYMRASWRYEVCAATQVKGVRYYLKDWVQYHRRVGVDHIYVLDNGDADDLAALLGHRGDVEVVQWPWAKSQVQAFSFLLVALRRRCRWVVMSDVDEYVMMGIGAKFDDLGNDEEGEPLRRWLRRNGESKRQSAAAAAAEGAGQAKQGGKTETRGDAEGDDRRVGHYDAIFVPFVVIGHSGHVYRPKGQALAEAYTFLHGKQNLNGKSIVRTDHDWTFSSIHFAQGRSWVRAYRNASWTRTPTRGDDAMSLVHFQKRSLEEMIAKRRGGSASTTDRQGAETGDSTVKDLDVRRPPSYYLEKPAELAFTHFRSTWRAVMGGRDGRGSGRGGPKRGKGRKKKSGSSGGEVELNVVLVREPMTSRGASEGAESLVTPSSPPPSRSASGRLTARAGRWSCTWRARMTEGEHEVRIEEGDLKCGVNGAK